MTIGIVGLGLIGGSLAKAFTSYTNDTIYGIDISDEINKIAVNQRVIHDKLTDENLTDCDVIYVALYPDAAVEYIKSHAELIKKGAIVTDCSGVKSSVCLALKDLSENGDFEFVGGHPMAGTARGGYINSFPELFQNASLILTPYESTSKESIDTLWDLASKIGFSRLQISTPERHDEMVAYTSHLCHVISCAYIGSPLADDYKGYSAGSFKDLTRVARINEIMWTDLFIENKNHLIDATDDFINRLLEIKQLIHSEDREGLRNMLRKSRETKESLD